MKKPERKRTTYDWQKVVDGGRIRVPAHSAASAARGWALRKGLDVKFTTQMDKKGVIWIYRA